MDGHENHRVRRSELGSSHAGGGQNFVYDMASHGSKAYDCRLHNLECGHFLSSSQAAHKAHVFLFVPQSVIFHTHVAKPWTKSSCNQDPNPNPDGGSFLWHGGMYLHRSANLDVTDCPTELYGPIEPIIWSYFPNLSMVCWFESTSFN